MLNKKVTLLSFAASFLFSCTQKNNYGDFSVKGRVDNAPTTTMYLEKLSYDGSDAKVIDSCKIENNTYKLHGTDTEEELYVLSFNHIPAIIFVNDAKEAEINFNMDRFRNPSVFGSKATEQLYTFIHNYFSQDSLLSRLSYRVDTLKQNHPGSPEIDSLQKIGAIQLAGLNSIVSMFIQNSNSPASICFALDKAKASMPIDQLDKLAKDASAKFSNHSGLAIFKSQIAQLTAAETNPEDESSDLINKQAPDLTMNDMTGKPLSISSFRGKYLLVDFWASWCGPCRQENPNVVLAYNKFKNKNFEILGVSLDKDKDSWFKAIRDDKLAWPQMSDLKYWESAAVKAYNFNGIPFNVLIDPNGKIIASGLRGNALEQKLSQVLK